MINLESTPATGQGGEGKSIQNTSQEKDTTKHPKVKPGTKLFNVLLALAQGRSFNRFEAERELHDHCLHSTVSTIQRLGVRVYRQRETVPCLGGTKTTDVMRYRLLPHEIEKAEMLLGA